MLLIQKFSGDSNIKPLKVIRLSIIRGQNKPRPIKAIFSSQLMRLRC